MERMDWKSLLKEGANLSKHIIAILSLLGFILTAFTIFFVSLKHNITISSSDTIGFFIVGGIFAGIILWIIYFYNSFIEDKNEELRKKAYLAIASMAFSGFLIMLMLLVYKDMPHGKALNVFLLVLLILSVLTSLILKFVLKVSGNGWVLFFYVFFYIYILFFVFALLGVIIFKQSDGSSYGISIIVYLILTLYIILSPIFIKKDFINGTIILIMLLGFLFTITDIPYLSLRLSYKGGDIPVCFSTRDNPGGFYKAILIYRGERFTRLRMVSSKDKKVSRQECEDWLKNPKIGSSNQPHILLINKDAIQEMIFKNPKWKETEKP